MTTPADTADWAKIVSQGELVTLLGSSVAQVANPLTVGPSYVGNANSIDIIAQPVDFQSGEGCRVKVEWMDPSFTVLSTEWVTCWTLTDGFASTFIRLDVKGPYVKVTMQVVQLAGNPQSLYVYASSRTLQSEVIASSPLGDQAWRGQANPVSVPAGGTFDDYFAPVPGKAEITIGAAPAGCTTQIWILTATTITTGFLHYRDIVADPAVRTYYTMPASRCAFMTRRINSTAAAVNMTVAVIAES